jgi:hypothetical protein
MCDPVVKAKVLLCARHVQELLIQFQEKMLKNFKNLDKEEIFL